MIQLIKNIYFKLFKKKSNDEDEISDNNMNKDNENTIDIISCKVRFIKEK